MEIEFYDRGKERVCLANCIEIILAPVITEKFITGANIISRDKMGFIWSILALED